MNKQEQQRPKSVGEYALRSAQDAWSFLKRVSKRREAQQSNPERTRMSPEEMDTRANFLTHNLTNLDLYIKDILKRLSRAQRNAAEEGEFGPNMTDERVERHSTEAKVLRMLSGVIEPVKEHLHSLVGTSETSSDDEAAVAQEKPKRKAKNSERFFRFKRFALRRLVLVMLSITTTFSSLRAGEVNDDDPDYSQSQSDENNPIETIQEIALELGAAAERLGDLLREADELITIAAEQEDLAAPETGDPDFSIAIASAREHNITFQRSLDGGQVSSESPTISNFFFSPHIDETTGNWIIETNADGQEFLQVYFNTHSRLDFPDLNSDELRLWSLMYVPLNEALSDCLLANNVALPSVDGTNRAEQEAPTEVIETVTYLTTSNFNSGFNIRTEPSANGTIVGTVGRYGSSNLLIVNHENGTPIAVTSEGNQVALTQDGWILIRLGEFDEEGNFISASEEDWWINTSALSGTATYETVETQVTRQESELLEVSPEEINVHEFTVSRTALEAIFGEGNVGFIESNGDATLNVFSDRLIESLLNSAELSGNHGDAVFARALENAVSEARNMGLNFLETTDELASRQERTNIVFIAILNPDGDNNPANDTFTVNFILETYSPVPLEEDVNDSDSEDGLHVSQIIMMVPSESGVPTAEARPVEEGQNSWFGVLDSETVDVLTTLFPDVAESEWTNSNATITTWVVRNTSVQPPTINEQPAEIRFLDGKSVVFTRRADGTIATATFTPTPTEAPTESLTTPLENLFGTFTIVVEDGQNFGHIEFFNVPVTGENANGGESRVEGTQVFSLNTVYYPDDLVTILGTERVTDLGSIPNGRPYAGIVAELVSHSQNGQYPTFRVGNTTFGIAPSFMGSYYFNTETEQRLFGVGGTEFVNAFSTDVAVGERVLLLVSLENPGGEQDPLLQHIVNRDENNTVYSAEDFLTCLAAGNCPRLGTGDRGNAGNPGFSLWGLISEIEVQN